MEKIDGLIIVATGIFVLSLVGFFYLPEIQQMTGRATDTKGATANLSIIEQSSIEFTVANVNWGAGMVWTNSTNAWMDTENGRGGGNWSFVNTPLILRNNGNSNVSVTLNSSTPESFIGGTEPWYEFKVSNKSGEPSCSASTATSYANFTAANQNACTNLGFLDSQDEIDIDLNVTVPQDAVPGSKGAVITAVATTL